MTKYGTRFKAMTGLYNERIGIIQYNHALTQQNQDTKLIMKHVGFAITTKLGFAIGILVHDQDQEVDYTNLIFSSEFFGNKTGTPNLSNSMEWLTPWWPFRKYVNWYKDDLLANRGQNCTIFCLKRNTKNQREV